MSYEFSCLKLVFYSENGNTVSNLTFAADFEIREKSKFKTGRELFTFVPQTAG